MITRAALVTVAFLAAGCAAVRTAPHGVPMRTDESFRFTVRLSAGEAFGLFGADGERAWAPDWDPAFVHPQPARDEDGMVFIEGQGDAQAVWINTAFDRDAGHIQYVYVRPGTMAVCIDLDLRRVAERETTVSVRYRRTALRPEASPFVQEMARHDRAAGPEWESLIAARLARGPLAH